MPIFDISLNPEFFTRRLEKPSFTSGFFARRSTRKTTLIDLRHIKRNVQNLVIKNLQFHELSCQSNAENWIMLHCTRKSDTYEQSLQILHQKLRGLRCIRVISYNCIMANTTVLCFIGTVFGDRGRANNCGYIDRT